MVHVVHSGVVTRGAIAPSTPRRAYTLVELLVVIVILGIASALIIPAMSQAGSVRVQGAIRMIVSDITTAQSDAIAYQQGRAILFRYTGDATRYVVADIVGAAVDTTTSGLTADRNIGGNQFGGSSITTTTLTANTLYFDELGGPVDAPGSDTPAASGYVEITAGDQIYRINIEAYTGRVSVLRM